MINKTPVAIIGSGNIGTDLLLKIKKSKFLDCVAFIGRSANSTGIKFALEFNQNVFINGINFFLENPNSCKIVFDATSASSHKENNEIFKKLNLKVVDLTPARIGKMCIPSVNINAISNVSNVNMVTCGGQASIPVTYAISQTHPAIDYIEVVSTISSRSAGPATRINLDDYIHTTENAIKFFTKAKKVKAILNLNPANPAITMQTTIFAKVKQPNIKKLDIFLKKIISKINQYVPGYELILGPLVEDGRLVIMIRVIGLGDYLPSFAGNLDIINCAAINVAEYWAEMHKNENFN